MRPFLDDLAVLCWGLALAAGLLLLWGVLAQAQAQTTYYTRQQGGSDAHTCAQAQSTQTPRASINRGIACLSAGDTLRIGSGTYDELLVGLYSSTTCSSGDTAVQPGCAIIPNGLSPDKPTRLIADTPTVVLSPKGRKLPGGGGAITLYDASKHLHFEGLRLLLDQAPGSAGSITFGGAQHVTFTRGEVHGAESYANPQSRHLTITHSHFHHAGVPQGCNTDVQRTPPCLHGLYICGKHHVISDNLAEYNSNFGIQVSCEQGGIEDVRIERNVVRYNRGVGIRASGSGHVVASNLLVGNGQGLTASGTVILAHNTIHGYRSDHPDPWGIFWTTGTGIQVIDNILTGQKSSFYVLGQTNFTAPDPSQVHHNLCDLEGNPGCLLRGTAATVYANAAQGDFTLHPSASNPARGVGVPVAGVTHDLQGRPFHATTPSVGAYASEGAPPPSGADVTAPQVQITTPVAGAMLSGPAVTLQATASDNVAVVRVQFYADGQAIGQTQSSAPYQSVLDSTTVPNGPYTLTAEAVDAAGNRTLSPPVPVTVTNGPIGPARPQPPGAWPLSCTGALGAEGRITLECQPLTRR